MPNAISTSRAPDAIAVVATSPPAMGVYVHFPWCLTKCPYCDFLSVAVPGPRPGLPPNAEEARALLPHQAYADSVLRELDARMEFLRRPLPRLRSVFFGGGTPSLWEPKALGRVLRAILEAYETQAGSVEVTVECNPTSLDRKHVHQLLEQGVNRLSVGVQSLSKERLLFLGRLHDEADGLRALHDALAMGVPRVSADLIYGVFKQQPGAAVREVERVADTGVTHVSAYALTIESNTRFGALSRSGQLPLLDDSLIAESFTAVSEALQRRGLRHYEISNFAAADHESLHNRGYWQGDDYLGLGTGAFGTVSLSGLTEGRLRYKNVLSPERYMATFGAQSVPEAPFVAPLADREFIDGATSLQEALLLGLRLADGIDVEVTAARHSVDPWTPSRQRAVEKLVRQGRLVREGARLRVPSEHWLFCDGIIRDLL